MKIGGPSSSIHETGPQPSQKENISPLSVISPHNNLLGFCSNCPISKSRKNVYFDTNMSYDQMIEITIVPKLIF